MSDTHADVYIHLATDGPALAVLISGGMDSAVLLAEALRSREAVFPLYIRCGLLWEEAELHHLRHFLTEIGCAVLRPLVILDQPAQDLYGDHWSLTGTQVPGAETADEAVFLPGRNVLLLSKALLWCHLNGVHALALASLESNPFPDATPEFLSALADVVNQAVGGRVVVRQPYRGLHKSDVLRRGRELQLPLAWTFSCLRPRQLHPCGACNKCAERRRVFRAVGLADPTPYCLPESPCSA